MLNIVTRRDFLKTAAVFSSIGLAPAFLTRAAEGLAPAVEGFKDDRVLVVVQLGGGNDGLNTVVPQSNDTYYRLRPQLGLKKDRVLRLNDEQQARGPDAPLRPGASRPDSVRGLSQPGPFPLPVDGDLAHRERRRCVLRHRLDRTLLRQLLLGLGTATGRRRRR